jgi:DNA-binding response OmpR family regulator
MSKVLLIEDELSLRELYCEVLTDAGYVVESIGDGAQALEQIRCGEWDVLLLDIMLPKLDGLEVLKQVSADDKLSKKPIIVLSNLDNETVVKQCLDLGARKFLIKADITPQDILSVVADCFLDEQQA